MNGVVCMLIHQQKTTGAVWRRTSGIERRKASLFKSLRRFSHPLGPKWVKIVATKGSDKGIFFKEESNVAVGKVGGGWEGLGSGKSKVGQERERAGRAGQAGQAVEQM